MEVSLYFDSRMLKRSGNDHLEIKSLMSIEKMCEQYIDRYSDHMDYTILMQLLIFRDEVSNRLRRLRREEKLKNHYKIYK